jgi:glucose-1-phosphate cytidylyltransferase
MDDITAVLLCGGKGERLRPFTDKMPKPLLPLNGKPLLAHLMHWLAAAGVRRFVVCVGYKAEILEAFVRELRQPGWDVVCVNSGDASMTDRLLDARRHVQGRALICYGDTIANVDVAALRRHHEAQGALVTMTVYPLRSPFGVVSFGSDGRVTGFLEKPWLPHWINVGYMLCEPAGLDYLCPGSDMVAYLEKLAGDGALQAFRHEGKHLTVNTEKDRQQAEQDIIEFYTVLSDHSS